MEPTGPKLRSSDASKLLEDGEGVALEVLQASTDGTLGDVLFRPNDSHRKLKARFWTLFQDQPLQGPKAVTPTLVARMTGDQRIIKWWSQPGFKDWFLNAEENRERVEFLFSLALDAAETILRNDDPKAQSARVNVIKLIAELANKIPERNIKQVYADEHIQKMDRVQLEEYLKRQGVAVDSIVGSTSSTKEESE